MPVERRSNLLFPLTIVFGVSFIIFIYTAGYSWSVGGEAITQSVPWLYSSVAISGASIFALSILYYSGKLQRITPLQRILLAFFNLGTYFCFVALAVWGLVFPILRPITDPNFQLYLLNQRGLAMGLYTGLVLCSIVIVFRIALQLLIARSNTIMIISTSSNPQFGNTIPLRGSAAAAEDGSLENKISSIHLEIAKLREEIALLNAPNPALRLSSLVGAVNTPENNRRSTIGPLGEIETLPPTITETFAQNLPTSDSAPEETEMEEMTNDNGIQLEASFSPELSPSSVGGPQIPDSARDNPWASVLSKRQPAAPPKPIQKPKTTKKPKKRAQKEKPVSESGSPTEVTKVESVPPSSIPDDKNENSIP